MNQKQQKIPSLRFPEFDGEWSRVKLANVSKNIMYGIGSAAKEFDGKNKYLRITDIDEELRSFKPNPLTSPEGKIDEKYKLKNDDIVFARTGASVGKSYIYNEGDGNLIFAGFLIKVSINNASSKFVFYNTLRYSYDKWVKAMSMRSGQPGINAEEYKNYSFFTPTLTEQQKIAAFLTSVDKRIQALEQKKEFLEMYKKGVMQKIFSREIRFQPGTITNHLPLAAEPSIEYGGNKSYPDWKVKKLGDIGSTYNGLTGKTKEDFGSGEPYIQYKQIFDNSKIDITKVDYVNIAEKDKQNRAKFGDVFFTTSSETPNEIGTASVLLEDLEEIYLNSFCFGFRPKSLQVLDPHFSRYLFRSETFRKKIIKLAQGSTRYNMSKVQLLKLKVKLPCLEEQQKIAGFLSTIDTKIEAVTSQIDHSKTFKKGLLQKMFV